MRLVPRRPVQVAFLDSRLLQAVRSRRGEEEEQVPVEVESGAAVHAFSNKTITIQMTITE